MYPWPIASYRIYQKMSICVHSVFIEIVDVASDKYKNANIFYFLSLHHILKMLSNKIYIKKYYLLQRF